MPISFTKPPYLFTIQTAFVGGQFTRRIVQISGRPGDIGRVTLPISRAKRSDQHSSRLSIGLTV